MQFPRLIDDTLLRCRDMLASSEEQSAARVLQVSQLEQRILLNAAPVDAAMLPDAGQSAVDGEIAADDLASLVASATESATQSAAQQQASASSDNADESKRRELVFVDMGVSGATDLLHELWAVDEADREYEIVLIKSTEDGIAKISDTLAAQATPVDAVHVLSHGSGPAIQLGNVWLDDETLASRRAEISGWSAFLSDEVDLLFYGCELADSEAGRDLLHELGEVTGADLAASTDDTGAAALGGDWVLEYRRGDVETAAIVANDWLALLATPVGTDDFYHVDAVTGLTIDAVNGVLANDSGTGIQAVLVSGPTDAASFTLNADGSFSYTPNSQTGVDAFTYVADDGVETSAPVTVRLDMQPTTGGFVGDVEELALTSSSNERTLTTSGGQAVAALPDGRYVVVYTEDVGGGDLDVYAQRYQADGTLVGGRLDVGVFLTGTQHEASVSAKTTALYPNGLFTVAYTDTHLGSSDVYVASYRFDTGAAISNATLVNTNGGDQSDVAIDHLAGGHFAAVRAQENLVGAASTNSQIVLDLYPNTGLTMLQSELAVSDVTDGQTHTRPSVTSTSDGGFAVVWESTNSGSTIHYRKYDAAGNPETAIISLASGNVRDSGIAQGTNGDLLVSFVRDFDKVVTLSITPDGSIKGSENTVRHFGSNSYTDVKVIALADGTYAVSHTIHYGSGGTDPSFVRVSATGQTITNQSEWNAPNKIRNDGQQTLHTLAQGSNVRVFWDGSANGAATDVQTRLLRPYVPITTSSISGHVGEDFDGNGTLDGIDTQGVTVRLWQDDGDATIDVGDTFVTSTTTAADGTYSFIGLADGDYYVTFDSRTVASTTTLNAGYTQADVWASQTVFDENAVTFNVTGNPTASRPNRSDDATSLLTSNHVAAITVAGSDVTDVDAGFSFRVVDTTADGDDDLANGRSVQGSLRQFIQNANALSGSQQSYFNIEAGAPGLSGGIATITLALALPTIDESTILDGRDQPGFSSPVVQIESVGVGSGSVLELVGDSITVTGFALLNGADHGIAISGNSAFISGNFIGVDWTGSVDRGMTGHGIYVTGNNAQIGGPTSANRNVISGNGGDGVRVDGADGTVVIGNYIGLTRAGTSPLSNSGDGVGVTGSASNTRIGGSTSGQRNFISGNTANGVHILSAAGTDILGNWIGLGTDGSVIGNGDDGIAVTSSSSNITIGGSGVGEGNVIAGNTNDGVRITGSSDVGVRGNYVGTDSTGLIARGNGNHGINVDLNPGVVTVSDNVIGDATGHALRIADNTGGVVVSSNLIGIGSDGQTAIANGTDAILVADSSNVDIGVVGASNVIGNSTGTAASAIQINRSSAVSVVANTIGMTADESAAAPNVGTGVRIAQSSDVQVGGSTAAEANVIGNSDHAIHVREASTNVRVQGNVIGTNTSQTANYVNAAAAIRIRDDVTNVLIGGTTTGQGNHIEHANIAGVQIIEHVNGDIPSGISVLGNTFGSSVTNGIDLTSNFDGNAPAGPNSNDTFDADTGVNGLQNTPVLTSSRNEGTRTRLAGTVNTTANTSVRIELFAATNGLAGQYGPGEVYLGTITVTTDASGNAGYVVYSGTVVPTGDSVTATATNLATGETSEFALNVETTAATLIDLDPSEVGSGATSAYAEGQPAQLLFPTATVSDADSPNLALATLTITDAVDSSEQLAVDTTGTPVTAAWDAGTHTLTLSGPATQAEFEAVLQSATYVNNSGTVTAGARTVRVSANDGDMASPFVFATVTVSGTNAAPVITIPAAQDVVREGLLEFSISNGNAITLADADAGSADVELTIVAGNGTFSLASTVGLNFTFGDGSDDSTTIVRGSLADLNAALDGMTFSPTPGFDGAANLVLSQDDLGNTGGPAQTDGAVLAINVLATNTNPTVTVTALIVDENQPAGASVGKVTATDPDPGDAVTYSLADDAGGLFTIDSVTGDIRTTQPLDFETASSHTLTIQVRDRPGITVLTSRTVTVNDLPEGALPITLTVPPLSVAENQAVGTTVGTVSAVDPNFGATVTFSLDNDAGGLFAIDVATGAITTNNTLNHEVSSSRSITIRATSSAGAFDVQTVSVSVADVNETPSLTVSSTSISEGAPAGSVVTLALVADVDAGDTHSFTLDNDGGGLFEIDAATGVIRTAGTLDHETAASHSLTVRVADAGGRFDTATISVTVTDANEAPVLSVPSMSVSEGLPTGTVVGAVTATDVDAGDVLTYSLDNDAGGRFAIDSTTGVVTTTTTLDHELAAAHSITVRVADAAGAFDTATVSVAVTDVNEAPRLVVPVLAVDEGLPSGAVAGAVTATDIDSGETLTYSLDSDAGGLFVIDSTTGVVATTAPLDHTVSTSHSLVVRVTDSGGSFDVASVDVAVQPVNGLTQINGPGVVSAAEDQPVLVSGLTVTNPESDEVLQARWSIVSGDIETVPADFTGTVGELNAFLAGTVLTLSQDADQPAEVQLQVVDELDRLVAFDLFIDVTGVNDAPVAAGEGFFVSADDLLLLDYDDLLANDDDVDSLSLTVEIDETINGGIVFDDGLGIVFVPNLDFAGVAELSYRVFDGEDFSEWVVAAISVDASESLPFFDADGGVGFDDGGFDFDADSFDPFDQDFGDSDSFDEDIELVFEFDLDIELESEFEDEFDHGLSDSAPQDPTPDAPVVDTQTIQPETESTPPVVVEVFTPADTADAPPAPATSELVAGLAPDSETMVDHRDATGRLSRGDGSGVRGAGQPDGLRFRTSLESSTGLAGLAIPGFSDMPRLILEQPAMFEEFDRAVESVEQIRQRQAFVAGSAVVSGTALTIGYAVWTARGGYLLASLMSAMPTWKFMDPLLVLSDLEAWQNDLPETDISLEDLIRDR